MSGQLAAHGRGAIADAVHRTAVSAFDHGLSVGCVVAGAVALAGALLAVAFLPAQPSPPPGSDHQLSGPTAPTTDEKDLVR